VGEALWPERFPVPFLHEMRRMDPSGYSALYQQRPSPEEGAYFKADEIVLYAPNERPAIEDMRIYCASDHALGQDKKLHDASVFLVGGMCSRGNIWLLDCFWGRVPSNVATEQILDMIVTWRPILWWAEDGHITKSIGPFLQKRALERNVPVPIETVTPVKTKEQRAQSAKGLMAMKRVLFPRGVPWVQHARHELLQFPNGANDDFVDAISLLGLKLVQIVGAIEHKPGPTIQRGTWAWWKREMKFQERTSKVMAEEGGW
jgi:predicted phage terminase large subunit-like protein